MPRKEAEARFGDIKDTVAGLTQAVTRLTESVTASNKTSEERDVKNAVATAELRGYVKGTTTAISIVSGVVMALVALFAFVVK